MESEHFLENNSSYQHINTDLHHEIVKKYIDIINRFIIHSIEESQNQSFHILYIYIQNGLNILYHIFFITFFYTKNLNSSIKNTITGMLYYTEFFKQINQNDMNQNLNYKDASIFVYSKTLFHIDKKFSKNIHSIHSKWNLSSFTSKVYQDILLLLIFYHKSLLCHQKLYSIFSSFLTSNSISTLFEPTITHFNKWIITIIPLIPSHLITLYISIFFSFSKKFKCIPNFHNILNNTHYIQYIIQHFSPLHTISLFFQK